MPDRHRPVGFVLASCGLALVLYALSQAAAKGWDRPHLIALWTAGHILTRA